MPVEAQKVLTIERFVDNPIIRPEMLPGTDGENINGPSLIRVPSWVPGALGKYYLYFAHHAGSYIRLAYADNLAGPWKIFEPGTLQLENTICNDIHETVSAGYRHIASPDVLLDHENREIRMYFHGTGYLSGPRDNPYGYTQISLVATSKDGINFDPGSEPLGNGYFRVFRWGTVYYALSMPGVFYRSKDGLRGFEVGPTLFSADMRHSAVIVQEGKLLVFYTDVGESPERILLSEIDLRLDWMRWKESAPIVVLEPEREWEGVLLPLEPSVRGSAPNPVRQLRDPAIFSDGGSNFLLYSVAGESGIAIAELFWK